MTKTEQSLQLYDRFPIDRSFRAKELSTDVIRKRKTHLTRGTQDIWLEERILPEERSIAKHYKHLTGGTQDIWPEERILPEERKTSGWRNASYRRNVV